MKGRTILSESPCYYTRNAVAKFFKDVKETEDVRTNLFTRLSKAKVNAFLMDPVPGGRYMYIPGIAWRDDRFYLKPPCNAAELLIFRDERTRCFKPIIPNGLTPIVTPGHHGTASGNIYTQQLHPVVVESGANDTSTVQQLTVGKLFNFINKHTGLFDSPTEEINLEHPKLDVLTNSFLNKSQAGRSKLLLDLYQRVHENDAAYKLLSKGGYAYLGTEYSRTKTRLVHYGAHNSMGLDTIVTSLDGQFVNAEHASLYLHDQMEFSLDDEKYQLDALTSKFSVVLNNLFQGFKDNNVKIKALLDEPQRKVTFQALLVFVDSISQKYLRNHLSETIKTNLLKEIDTIFDTLKSFKEVAVENPINGIIAECEKMLRLGIQQTANSHYSALLDQTVKLEKESEYFLTSNEEFVGVLDSFLRALEEKLSEEDEVTGFLRTIHNNLSRIESVTVSSVGKALQDSILALTSSENEAALKAIDVLTELMTDKTFALDRYLDAEIPNKDVFFAELNRVYDNLASLTNGHLHVQKLVGKEKLEFTPRKLVLHQEIVIKLAAQILFKKKVDLHDKPDSMSVDFFRKVKAQAIALGADNPDIIDLQRVVVQLHKDKELALAELKRAVKEFHSDIDKLQHELDVKLEQEKIAHGKEKEELSLTIEQLHGDIALLNRTSTEKLRLLETQLETAAEQYRKGLMQQKQQTAEVLEKTRRELTVEKEQVEHILKEKLQAVEHASGELKAQLEEQITDLKQSLSSLKSDHAQQIEKLQEVARLAAERHQQELKSQQQQAEEALKDARRELTVEKEQVERILKEKLQAVEHASGELKAQLEEQITDLKQSLSSLKSDHAQQIEKLQEVARLAAERHQQELRSQQQQAEEALKDARRELTVEKEKIEAQLNKKLQLAGNAHQQDKARLELEVRELQQQLASLKEHINQLQVKAAVSTENTESQLKKLQAEQQKQAELIVKLQSSKEIACVNFINDKLLPLTENYAAYLKQEALKLNPSFTPAHYKDLSSFTGLPADQEKYTKIIAKYTVIQNLLVDLTDKDTNPLPSDRIVQFTQSLKKSDVELKQHRDEAWMGYFKTTMVAISVVCTGIIPGILLLLAYSAIKGTSPLFFAQSKGEQFINKANYSLSDLHQEKSDENQSDELPGPTLISPVA